ncbi:MAG: hypothetical protein WC718_02370 [Phycisphaerales bacterium]|jgi:hypothetical protein
MLQRRIGGRVVSAAMCVAGIAWSAGAQTISPLAEDKDPLPPTRPWTELLRVKSEKTWDAKLTVKMAFPQLRGEAEPDERLQNAPLPMVAGVTFVLPWVGLGATQLADVTSVRMRGWMGLWEVPGPAAWLKSVPGTELLQGLKVSSPDGQPLDFAPADGRANLEVHFAPGGGSREALKAQFEISFRTNSRKVELDERVAAGVAWPASWPHEARGALERQPFLDFYFDAVTGMATDLDADELKAFAMAILKSGGSDDPRAVPPMLLAQGVAASVIPGLKPTGDAVLYATWDYRSPGIMMRVIDPSPGGTVPAIQNVIAGFKVRDALTIMESGEANDAERAIALAAVYRQLGLPARVMIGFEADRDDDELIARRLGNGDLEGLKPTSQEVRQRLNEAEQKAVEADAIKKKKQKKERSQPLMWPHLPPFRFVEVHRALNGAPRTKRSGYPAKSAGGARRYPGWKLVQQQRGITPQDQKTVAEEFRRNSSKLKRARYWVEFAAYDAEKGLAWVPVDPGNGADDWTFGSVRGSERIVAVATGFWPTGVERVYRYRSWENPTRPDLFAKDEANKLMFSSMEIRGLMQSATKTPFLMAAGLWGMFTSPEVGQASWQEVGFEATRATARSSDSLPTPTREGQERSGE